MPETLVFWPKAAVMAYVSVAAGGAEYVYTKALPTSDFKEVVAQLECDAKISHDSMSSITVVSQISNDGANWDDSSTAFTSIDQSGTYPKKEMIKITAIAAFMRFCIRMNEDPILGADGIIGGTLLISGEGRS